MLHFISVYIFFAEVKTILRDRNTSYVDSELWPLQIYTGNGQHLPDYKRLIVIHTKWTISTVILLPSAESFKKGCCQLQAKVCARSTG